MCYMWGSTCKLVNVTKCKYNHNNWTNTFFVTLFVFLWLLVIVIFIWINYIFSLQSLLHDPNVTSPANNEAAKLYNDNRREYEKRVVAIVQESWLDDEATSNDDEKDED